MRPHTIPERIPYRIPGIIAVLVLVLQGCGHKGPLMLPAPPAQTTSPQKPDLPSSQQNKSP